MTIGFRRRPGYTLVELVLGIAVMTVLMAGLGSTMIIASRAIPDGSSPLAAAIDASAAADQMAGDLFVAKSFTLRSPTAVEFTVADRTGDLTDDVIRYEWSAAAGEPVTRKLNADDPVVVVDDVHEFGLVYTTVRVEETTPPAVNESEETLLYGYNSVKYLGDWAVTNPQRIGQYFMPDLPAGATEWKISRVKLMARVHGANAGICRVQLQTATTNTSNVPSGIVVDESELLESELSDEYLWKEVAFSGASGLAPDTGMCVLVQWIKDAHAADFQYQVSAASPLSGSLLTTNNGGITWPGASQQSMLIEVYGTVTTSSAPSVTSANYLTGVRIRLRKGADEAARVESSVQILNEPEVLGS